MGRTGYDPALLGAAVDRLADQFGETTGACPVCARPVRLMRASGLVPPHAPAGRRGNYCSGGERLPAADPPPTDPDLPRPGRLIATIVPLILLLARHRPAEPAGEPLGHRRGDPRHAEGDWHPPRDEPSTPAWPGGRRPPLADNLPKETPR